jgi:lysophospholipase L1-like esterase
MDRSKILNIKKINYGIKVKKYFIASLIINIIFAIFVLIFIIKKGGLEYIKEKIGFKTVAEVEPVVQDTVPKRSYFYNLQTGIYKELSVDSGDIVFFGDSHFQIMPWHEFLDIPNIKVRGIGGDNLQGMIDRAEFELHGNPKRIIIIAGNNNINQGNRGEEIIEEFKKLIAKIRLININTSIDIISIIPMGRSYYNAAQKNIEILKANSILKEMQRELNYRFIDLHSQVKDDENFLRQIYSYEDDIHLSLEGYMIFKEVLKPYLK